MTGLLKKQKSPVKVSRKASRLPYMWRRMGRRGREEGEGGRGRVRRREDAGRGLHKPCLASEADTWSASVDSWGGSVMLMLPEDETVLSCCGESSSETISAPWSVRALADSRKLSLWLSICGGRGDRGGRGHSHVHDHNRLHWPSLATFVQSKTKAESRFSK